MYSLYIQGEGGKSLYVHLYKSITTTGKAPLLPSGLPDSGSCGEFSSGTQKDMSMFYPPRTCECDLILKKKKKKVFADVIKSGILR